MSKNTGLLMCAVALVALGPLATAAINGQKNGTLEDLRGLMQGETLAAESFNQLPFTMDASELDAANHHSRYSATIELEPAGKYTLGVIYRASGPSIVTAGVKWHIPGQTAGLVDVEDHRVRWPESGDWVLQALTFESDHEHTTARIVIKAWGGMTLEVQDVALVEGWYAD